MGWQEPHVCFCLALQNTPLTTDVFPGTWKMERKEKTSEEIMSKSCWVCVINHPVVWTRHTGCVTGFSRAPCIILAHELCAYLLAKMVPALSKWPEKRLGSSLVLKLYCIMFNRILTWYLQRFFFSRHLSRAKENLCYQVIQNMKKFWNYFTNLNLFTWTDYSLLFWIFSSERIIFAVKYVHRNWVN